jgi:hypothetical protein
MNHANQRLQHGRKVCSHGQESQMAQIMTIDHHDKFKYAI